MARDPYCYDDTDVLKNLADIRDPAKLEQFEKLNFLARYREPIPLTLSPGGISHIHHHLFKDTYTWAGEIRSVEMAKEGAPFCRPHLIEGNLAALTAKMNVDPNLQSADPRIFAASAAKHINELNVIHPFREGNGRTNRVILELLADNAGHRLEIDEAARNRWMSASIIGFRDLNDGPMADLIYDKIQNKEIERDKGR